MVVFPRGGSLRISAGISTPDSVSPDRRAPPLNGAEAVHLAERACELAHYGQPLFIGTLAAAYAEAGRYPEAVTTAEKAEQLATSARLKKIA